MKKAVFCFGLVLSLAALSVGQVRTVTNATLQKFQQKRLDAERDYRDNFARMGFPSPEELDRQREIDMSTRIELADQLRQARLEKERLELERRSLDLQAVRIDSEINADRYDGFYGGYFGGYGGFGGYDGFYSNGRYRRGGGRFPFATFDRRNRLLPVFPSLGAYRATPFGVIQEGRPRTITSFGGGFRRGFIRTGRH